MSQTKPVYDFNNDIFKKNPFYKRLAKDHLSLAEFQSNIIKLEVIDVRSALNIPCEYLIHFHVRSIVGIHENQMPIYGYHHKVRITFPPKYPIEPPELYMVSDVWHPNIKWDGKYKGRICGNTKGFGLGYDLFLLLVRIGEMLQFKQYHAEFTPPFPEDIHVAKWMLEFAEPNKIVNKKEGIVVDETPLVGDALPPKPADEPIIEEVKSLKITSQTIEDLNIPEVKAPPKKIVITGFKKLEKKPMNINKLED